MKKVGTISITGNRVLWTIPNYFSNTEKHVWSPPFHCVDKEWEIVVYPNARGGTEEWMEMFLLDDKNISGKYDVRLGIAGESGDEILGFVGKGNDNSLFTAEKMIRRSRFISEKDRLVPKGTLRLFCEIRRRGQNSSASARPGTSLSSNENRSQTNDSRQYSDVAVQTETELSMVHLQQAAEELIVRSGESSISFKVKGLEKLLQDLNDLWLSGRDSDLTINVKDREFKVHRSIFAARCPEFLRRHVEPSCDYNFFPDTSPQNLSDVNNSMNIVLEDGDPDSFADFISYLYTGSLLNFTSSSTLRLFSIASDYSVTELKAMCLNHLVHNVSVDNFCDIFRLALQHKEQGLQDVATQFFLQHSTDIVTTEEWQGFLKEYLAVGIALTRKALESRKK